MNKGNEAMKRGYSTAFKPGPEGFHRYLLDTIPVSLWQQVCAKAKREGISVRALILGWFSEWVREDSTTEESGGDSLSASS